MKKLFFFTLISIGFTFQTASAQDFGLSFSYFLPKNGNFSAPISPFSVRGVGVDLSRFLAIESGFSVYRMTGLYVKDMDPLKTTRTIAGPNFTLFIPAELVIQLGGQGVEFDLKGGGFFFYGLAQKLNEGELDRALREHEEWDVTNSDFTFKSKPGFGYHFGAELLLQVTNQFGISFETNYLIGQSGLPLSGTYTGGRSGGNLETKPADFPNAKIDLTGLEFSIGVFVTSGR